MIYTFIREDVKGQERRTKCSPCVLPKSALLKWPLPSVMVLTRCKRRLDYSPSTCNSHPEFSFADGRSISLLRESYLKSGKDWQWHVLFNSFPSPSVGIIFHLGGEKIVRGKRKSCCKELTLKRRSMLATMIDTELAEAPITPTTRSGLVMMGGPPLRHLTSVESFSIRAWTNVSDCSRAWVSREQVSRIRAPRVILGSSSLSLLMRSRANSMASSLWIPFSFFSSPQALPSFPLAWTGKRPPREMSPSMRIELRCVWPGILGLAAKPIKKEHASSNTQ